MTMERALKTDDFHAPTHASEPSTRRAYTKLIPLVLIGLWHQDARDPRERGALTKQGGCRVFRHGKWTREIAFHLMEEPHWKQLFVVDLDRFQLSSGWS